MSPQDAAAAVRVQVSIELTVKAELLAGKRGGQCVTFVNQFMGQLDDCANVDCYASPFHGAAGRIKPNADEPEVGYAVLTTEGPVGHAAVIIGIEGTDLVLAESNYGTYERVTVGRRIEIDDATIRGFFDFAPVSP